jgi:hypothetical protein
MAVRNYIKSSGTFFKINWDGARGWRGVRGLKCPLFREGFEPRWRLAVVWTGGCARPSTLGLFFRFLQSLLHGIDFVGQALGQMRAEFGEVFFDQRNFG